MLIDVSGTPGSRTDLRGGYCFRSQSTLTNISVDCWYGANGDQTTGDSGGQIVNATSGEPMRKVSRDQSSVTSPQGVKLNQIRRSSDMVMLFDGLLWHLGAVNANRLNARHNFRTMSNLLFFDGHAASYPTKDLPGGIGVAKPSDFSLSNLLLNHKSGNPVWDMGQP